VSQDIPRHALAGLDTAVQVTLEVLRGVLTAEVAVALASVLHSGESRVLADLPIRVGALCPLVCAPEVDGCATRPVIRDRDLRLVEERLQLGHELLRPRLGSAAAE